MNLMDITCKRSILFAARIRFSPETQPVKDSAIDKIIEQNLLIADIEKGLTLREIREQGVVSFVGGTPAIIQADMRNSLDRLIKNKRVIIIEELDQKRYKLSEQALNELWAIQRSTEECLEGIVGKLFKNATEGPLTYVTPFFECLCIIFSRLGETYVRIIKGEIGLDSLLREASILNALREIMKKYPSINHDLFEYALLSFFQDSDPDYNAIKWNMAQNYYVAKALGLDPSGYLLSKEAFGNSIFYIDTNIIIHALEPKAQHHESFKALSKACKQLQIELKVCQISLNQLKGVIEFHREILPKVENQIPDEIIPKVRGIFFTLYREQKSLTGTVNLDKVFASFNNPMQMLSQSYGVQLIDDLWFIDSESKPEIEKLAQSIQFAYQAQRGYRKRRRSALHDALLLKWIQSERKETERNIWLVTLDTSLPNLSPQLGNGQEKPMSITLDALLQWISPIAIQEDIEDQFAVIFSEALKYHLLPIENFFDLRDFLVFAEMEWSCKELPAQDVKECIRYLKTNAPNLDPLNPVDREKMAHEINKFFADPSRKYKQEVQRLETRIETLDKQYKQIIQVLESELRESDEKKKEFEKELLNEKEGKVKEALRKSAKNRVVVVVLLFIALEIVAFYLSWTYGKGENLIQKVLSSWILICLPLGITVITSYFYLGKKRIKTLGWSFIKLLKMGN